LLEGGEKYFGWLVLACFLISSIITSQHLTASKSSFVLRPQVRLAWTFPVDFMANFHFTVSLNLTL
jgi:hypothetical protein